MKTLTQALFHLICIRHYHPPDDQGENYFDAGFKSSETFFNRFDGKVKFTDNTILDYGCGFGSTCIYMALNGAKNVVGVDIDMARIKFAQSRLDDEYRRLSNIVQFKSTGNLLTEKFDIVLSKDSFEHYSNPIEILATMKDHVHSDGTIVIGFAPLWKSPYGGHISYMTRLPWAHLLFPEAVIMQERKRFRPDEKAESFEQIRGGLNKMTFKRFLSIIRASDLEIKFLRTNATSSKWGNLFNILRTLPFCSEYLTMNVYSMLRIRKTDS